jgi:chromosome partitioning protein
MNRSGWKLLEVRPVTPGAARVLCVANQKGGVGKTTTSVNLAASLALRGRKVLVVDLDPQANATTGIGLDRDSVETSSYDLMLGAADLAQVATATPIENLFCVPSSVDLAGAEVELVGELARERKLAEALTSAADRYDFVFIDCPPSLGLLTVNALVAAQDLIVPVQCEYYALEGLGRLLESAERIRRSLNPELRIVGLLMTMYDARTKLSMQVADEVRKHFSAQTFATVIPRSVRLSEAPSFGEPVVTLDPLSRGSIAYNLLAAELETRYGLVAEQPARKTPPPPPPPRPEPELVRAGAPGPGGRGYGTVAREPQGLNDAWPPSEPWSTS